MAIASYDYSDMSPDEWLMMLRAHFTVLGYMPVHRREMRARGLVLCGIQHEDGHAFVQMAGALDVGYFKGLVMGAKGGWHECQWELLCMELMGKLSHRVEAHHYEP